MSVFFPPQVRSYIFYCLLVQLHHFRLDSILHPGFRSTLAQLGEARCKSPEEFKAWSQNIGHEKVLTTFTKYGAVTSNRQAETIRSLGTERKPTLSVRRPVPKPCFANFEETNLARSRESRQYSLETAG